MRRRQYTLHACWNAQYELGHLNVTKSGPVGSFEKVTETREATRPAAKSRTVWQDGHALTRAVPREFTGRVSGREQAAEDTPAERGAQAHASEPQGADPQAGASGQSANEPEAAAAEGDLRSGGAGDAGASVGDLRLSLRPAAIAGAAAGTTTAANSAG